MKWLKDIKANTRPWLAFLSGSAANTSDEPDDTAIINQYFATYLQNVAADRIKPVSGKTNLYIKNTTTVVMQTQSILKHRYESCPP